MKYVKYLKLKVYEISLSASKYSELYEVFQIDMFGSMSIIVLTQIHIMFVHFFGIGSVSFYFLRLKLSLLDIKISKKERKANVSATYGCPLQCHKFKD